MKHTHKRAFKQAGRAGAILAAAVFSLGSTTAGAASGGGFVAKAPSLTPGAYAQGKASVIVEQRVERVAPAPVAVAVAPVQSSGGGSCGLGYIKQHESGGDYGAVSPNGKWRGAYQFDQGTWNSVGGKGDPAKASPAEQDARAKALYAQRGSQPWSVCH